MSVSNTKIVDDLAFLDVVRRAGALIRAEDLEQLTAEERAEAWTWAFDQIAANAASGALMTMSVRWPEGLSKAAARTREAETGVVQPPVKRRKKAR